MLGKINDNLDYAIICEDDILINNPDLLLFKIFQAKNIMVNSLADTPTVKHSYRYIELDIS